METEEKQTNFAFVANHKKKSQHAAAGTSEVKLVTPIYNVWR